MTKPHIGQFIDSMDPGGAEEVVINLSRELVNRGYPVTVFHFGNPWLRSRIAEQGLTGYELSLDHYKSTLTLPLFINGLRKVLKQNSVDILHAHLLGAILAGALAARFAGIPAIGTIHDSYSLYESRLHPIYLALASRAGARLVAVADTMQKEVVELSRLKPFAVSRIYNGISLEKFAAAERDSTANGPVVVTTVARAVAVKRLDLLLRMAAAIDTDIDYLFRIVGDGPLLDELKAQAKSLGVADRVEFLGHRDDVEKILAESDIYALVSDSEGLSVSLLESMASGLPSVVTDVGGNRELVADGESGLIASPGNALELTEKVTSLIENAERRKQFGAEARRRVETQFSIVAMTDAYVRLMTHTAVQHAG